MKIEFTIEGHHLPYTDEVEIDDEELDGLSPEERAEHIERVVEDSVFNVVNYGWQEVS